MSSLSPSLSPSLPPSLLPSLLPSVSIWAEGSAAPESTEGKEETEGKEGKAEEKETEGKAGAPLEGDAGDADEKKGSVKETEKDKDAPAGKDKDEGSAAAEDGAETLGGSTEGQAEGQAAKVAAAGDAKEAKETKEDKDESSNDAGIPKDEVFSIGDKHDLEFFAFEFERAGDPHWTATCAVGCANKCCKGPGTHKS